MGKMSPKFSQLFISALLLLTQLLYLADAINVGVCYGLIADNLPPPPDVIGLYKQSQIENLRIYQPYPEVLQALRGSNISVAVGPLNEEIAGFATSQDAANAWVNTNIVPYKDDVKFKWITIGNEIIPGPLGVNVPAAINNIRNALISVGLSGIKVTTVLAANALGSSFPPSAGAFAAEVTEIITNIATLLLPQEAPLMINIYPYFAYSSDPTNVSPDYALFTSQTAVVTDGALQYFNLFDAMVDGFNAALDKINFGSLRVAVAESGWPTLGNPPYTTIQNAQTYNKNLLNHVLNNGTPRRPGYLMDVFFFAMFNENQKPGEVEQNFGFFYPNKTPVYPFW